MAGARCAGRQGGVVLLSPGAPSFGAYRDYVARGRHFAELAGFDPDSISAIPGWASLEGVGRRPEPTGKFHPRMAWIYCSSSMNA
jgi:hypothetical protein